MNIGLNRDGIPCNALEAARRRGAGRLPAVHTMALTGRPPAAASDAALRERSAG